MAGTAGSLWRDLAALAVVLGVCAGLLRGLDVLPQAIGEPAGGRPFTRVADVERRLGERLAIPAFFPQRYRWPPTRIRLAARRPAAVLLAFTAIDAGMAGERLWLAQTVGGRDEVPAGIWPAGVVLDSAGAQVAGEDGTLERLLGEDGRVWFQVRWEQWDRRLQLRSAGPVAELLAMARSLRREGP